MPKFNFSTEEMQVYDLALDLARGDFSLHVDGDKVSKKDLEDHLRETINNDILKRATLHQAYRRKNIFIIIVYAFSVGYIIKIRHDVRRISDIIYSIR